VYSLDKVGIKELEDYGTRLQAFESEDNEGKIQ
jgi:hypothetical protein